MCTLTWWAGDAGYEVFFNRDEKKDRPVATPPELSEREGVRFLAPRDTAAGGTWMLVNEFGVTVTLLNWYSRETAPRSGSERRSRGQLVLDLGDVRDSAMLEHRLANFDPNRFQPFRLLAFFPGASGLSVDYWQWRGAGAFERGACPTIPVCSSSFDRSAVIEKREASFAEILAAGAGPERMWNYHHNSDSLGTSAYTVRMNRPDAQTWSINRITVTPARARFLYEAESLDHATGPEVFESSLDRPAVRVDSEETA